VGILTLEQYNNNLQELFYFENELGKFPVAVTSIVTSYSLSQKEYQLKGSKQYRPQNTYQGDLKITISLLSSSHKYSFNQYIRGAQRTNLITRFVDNYHYIDVQGLFLTGNQSLDNTDSGITQTISFSLTRSEVEVAAINYSRTTGALLARLNGMDRKGWYASDTLEGFSKIPEKPLTRGESNRIDKDRRSDSNLYG
jgi:hypothetical protein